MSYCWDLFAIGALGVVPAPLNGCRHARLMALSGFEAWDVTQLRNYVLLAHRAGCAARRGSRRAATLDELGRSRASLAREAAACRRHLVDAWDVAYYVATCTDPATVARAT